MQGSHARNPRPVVATPLAPGSEVGARRAMQCTAVAQRRFAALQRGWSWHLWHYPWWSDQPRAKLAPTEGVARRAYPRAGRAHARGADVGERERGLRSAHPRAVVAVVVALGHPLLSINDFCSKWGRSGVSARRAHGAGPAAVPHLTRHRRADFSRPHEDRDLGLHEQSRGRDLGLHEQSRGAGPRDSPDKCRGPTRRAAAGSWAPARTPVICCSLRGPMQTTSTSRAGQCYSPREGPRPCRAGRTRPAPLPCTARRTWRAPFRARARLALRATADM